MNASAPHIYVASDVPDGITLVEWRRRRHQPRQQGLLRRLRRKAPAEA